MEFSIANEPPRRQGDLTFVKVQSYKQSPKAEKKDILAVGETDHRHKLNQQVLVHPGRLPLGGEQKEAEFFTIEERAVLSHEKINGEKGEHNSIELPPGDWAMIHEREYDPFEEEVKTVRD